MTMHWGREHFEAAGEDSGVTLVELAVGLLIAAVMSTLMISWIFSIAAADDLHLADDEAVQDLRNAKDEITRELRRATELSAISNDSLTIWIDQDRDGAMTADEVVTWTFEPDGELVRSLGDGATSVRLTDVSLSGSGFSYDASVPEEVGSVGLTMEVFVDAPRGDDGIRSLTTEISLRGVS
jgi:hypothetical protein